MPSKTKPTPCDQKPKVSELRLRFEFVRASFAVENIHFTPQELDTFEECIRKRYRGRGMRRAFRLANA